MIKMFVISVRKLFWFRFDEGLFEYPWNYFIKIRKASKNRQIILKA